MSFYSAHSCPTVVPYSSASFAVLLPIVNNNIGNSDYIKNACLVNCDKLEHNIFPLFIICIRSFAVLIPFVLL